MKCIATRFKTLAMILRGGEFVCKGSNKKVVYITNHRRNYLLFFFYFLNISLNKRQPDCTQITIVVFVFLVSDHSLLLFKKKKNW